MRTRVVMAVGLGALLALAACHSKLGIKDDGKHVTLKQGDNFQVELSTNPSTGYRWNLTEIDPNVVRLVDRDYRASGGGIGSGGKETLTFKGFAPGTSSVKLVSLRPGQPDHTAGEYTLTVTVTAS